MLKISNAVELPDAEIEITQIRAQGAGGQNVNKVASKIDLRFDVKGVKKGAYIDNSFLMRVMASIDVLRPFVESYEGHIDVLRYTSDTSVATYWPYLIRAGIKEEAKGVFTTAWIREGHENFELGTYTSDALISTSDFTAYTK